MNRNGRRGPLLSAGTLIGAGMGGFVDGILLHQILQWHNMLSATIPPDNLIGAKVNMFWDGIFHALVWMMTALGIAILFGIGGRRDIFWSGRLFSGALLLGWGLFNLIEGVIDHEILGIHHVREYSPDKPLWDIGFLVLGALQIAGGVFLIRRRT